MSHQSDYRADRQMAERLAEHATDQAGSKPELAAVLASAAQVHATLALAAATRIASDQHDLEDE